MLSGDKGSMALPAQLSLAAKYGSVWDFLFTMIPRKNGEKAISLMSCLCDAYKSEILEASTYLKTGAIADVYSDMTVGEDKPYEWKCGVERWTDAESLVNRLVSTALHCIANCEDGEKELKDYQQKMVHVLARSFPVHKKDLFIVRFPFCSVSSEYLKAVSATLTDLHLFSDYQKESLIARMEDAVHPEHKLVSLTLQALSYNPHSFSPTPVSVVQWLAKVV